MAIGLFALLACGQSKQEITVARRVANVGESYTTTRDLKVRIRATPSIPTKPGGERIIKRHAVDTREILAVDGAGRVTKVRLRYERHEHSSPTGADVQVGTELAGNTYILERIGTRLKAVRDDRRISLEEVLLLRDEHDALGSADPFAALLGNRKLHVGKRLELGANEAALLLGEEPGLTADAGSLELVSIDGDVAEIKTQLSVAIESDGVVASGKAAGRLRANWRTGALISSTLDGTLEGKTREVPFVGSFEMRRTLNGRAFNGRVFHD